MLITLPDLVKRFCLDITGVLHVGAHLGEEAPQYHALGVPGDRVWWVEANTDVKAKLERAVVHRYGQHVIFDAVWSEDFTEVPFHVTNYDGMSSSVLEFGTHPEFSPDTVFVDHRTVTARTIDSLAAEHRIAANFLNLDIQGAELHALRGATDFLKGCIAVYSEVNTAEVYQGCAKLHELDELLAAAGFDRVDTHMVPGQGWGDALYVRSH